MSKYFTRKQKIEKGKKPVELQWVEVEGDHVLIVPWLQTFTYWEEDQDAEGHDAPFQLHYVIEARSGSALSTAFSKREAVDLAKKRLNRGTKRTTIRQINDLIREHGLSPRYKGLLQGDGTYAD